MIRPAQPDELALLSALALRSKAVWGYSAEFLEHCREELTVDQAELAGTYVQLSDERVVGFYTLAVSSDGAQAELEYLYVEPAALRRGHGQALLAHASQRARELGCSLICIQADPHAAAFYESAGAVQVGLRESGSIPGRMLPLYELRC
jgi:GNAT superfamily N-acetyltransferase